MNYIVEKVAIANNFELGEGPVWDEETNVLSWVDIVGKLICFYSLETKEFSSIETTKMVGFAIPTKLRNVYITGQGKSLILVDRLSGSSRFLIDIDEDETYNRLNDAKCDALGRLWPGTITENIKSSPGALYSFTSDFSLSVIINKVGCSNGLCWSKDNKKMYYIDSYAACLCEFDYDLSKGRLTNKKVILTYATNKGFLDGMTIDVEGYLWIAVWDGAKIIKVCPNKKKIIDSIELPVKKPTSLCFGGSDFKTLYITSANKDLSDIDQKLFPDNGSLLKIDMEVPGVENFKFDIEAY